MGKGLYLCMQWWSFYGLYIIRIIAIRALKRAIDHAERMPARYTIAQRLYDRSRMKTENH